ncbi:MAG: hypothetical protein K9K80_01280 [Spirochaetia bacterium]|nr:hypothetical protein [Spirochaetia bacterium]
MKTYKHKYNLIIMLLIFSFSVFGIHAQGERKKIVLVETMPVPVVQAHLKAAQEHLNKIGYVNGENTDIKIVRAEGDQQRAERILREDLLQGLPDVALTFATLATKAAKNVYKGTDVPIVFSVVSDPVGAGIVRAINEPTGTNITGLVYTISRKTKIETALEVLKPLNRKTPFRMGMVHSSYPSSSGGFEKLKREAQNHSSIEFAEHIIPYREVPEYLPQMLDEVTAAVPKLEEKIDFWWEPTGPLGEVEEYHRILMRRSSKPIAMANTIGSVKDGALMVILPDWEGGGREAAQLAHKVLEGEDAGSIPVSVPAGFEMAVNIDTALDIGAVFPPDILELAEGNIFHESR